MALDQALITAITTVGFPIAAFCLVYWDLRKKIEELSKAVQELTIKLA